MKKLLLIVILILSFQTLTKNVHANDVREFQIEGMSLGDSLLSFYSKQKIIDAIQISQYPGSDKYIIHTFRDEENYDQYDHITVDVLKNDNNYIIQAISGIVRYNNNIEECYILMDEITANFRKIFIGAKEYRSERNKLQYDKTGKSFQRFHEFTTKVGDVASIECNDWSKEVPRLQDSIMVSLLSKKYANFLSNEAY